MVKNRKQKAEGRRQSLVFFMPFPFRTAFSCLRLLPSAVCLPPSAFRLLLSAFRLLSSAFCLLLSAFCLLPSAYGFPLTCEISELQPRHRSLKVSCQATLPPGRAQVKFAEDFAGIQRLSERVFSLRVKDSNGAPLSPEIQGMGVFFLTLKERAQRVTISYELRLARALDPGEYPLTSSLSQEFGFLLLDDLLPRLSVAGEKPAAEKSERLGLKITLPSGWQLATTEQQRGEVFEIPDQSRAVFFLGQLREQQLNLNGRQLRLAITGRWNFTDEQAARLVESIAREQSALMGGLNPSEGEERFLITLAPYPIPLTGLRSSALTRHHTIVMMLNPASDSTAGPARTLAHYARHLAHEMFHYYLPGTLNVRENFDWFWEGFTRYVALVTLQRLKLISLREYLDALGDEYEVYAFNPARARLSLVAASPEKFANLANYELVYRKGMLVAGLYDLELRWQSEGKKNVVDVIRELYQKYARHGLEIGNREVLAELRRAGSFDRFISDDIEGTREIDLPAIIKTYGLVIERKPTSRPRIVAALKLSARQRAFLTLLVN